ncbi:MAG TPA: UDP-N-acetylmuramoyl-tripeptide--D-alanyl-D-alanine ligase [Ktedonobacterales bacterium]|nr:UDP-N-acetylmuramoyl-tripeptide--D-alanyl-D-alanine ligase [Ktedonobacterales bacterium]
MIVPNVFGMLTLIAGALVWLGLMARMGLMGARMYQIEEYEGKRLLAWGYQRAWALHQAAILGALIALSIIAGGLATQPSFIPHATWGRAFAGPAWLLGSVVALSSWRPLPAKKSLVYTSRMRRILAVAFMLCLALALLVIYVEYATALTPLVALLIFFSPILVLYILIAANWLLRPVEARIQAGYVSRARAKYTRIAPLTIGVAGSYGKTSVKHILAALLRPAMETLPTPKSYNTLMGITRTINENLEPRHKAFVVEMDAYGPGEIAAMCRLVDPTIAVVTSVGPQHLERFGTIERISDAMFELIAALPKGAPAVIYGGEARSAALADRAATAGYRAVRYGMEGEDAGPLDVIATDIQVDERATRFTWRWPAEGLEQRVAIPLLGQHNILNVSAALAVIHLLDIPVDEAARDALKLEAAPHRLQLIHSPGGMTIIDDSYNANPVGMRNGLEALQQMRGRHKILVTPGMVELGAVEEEENRSYGEHAAKICDYVILVGAKQTRPIAGGLRAGGFSDDHVRVVETLEEVTATLGEIAGPGDVALFANDLPDTYVALK